MKNIAHRGFSGKYPENTKVAFTKAIELEADMIELDVTLSRDRVPVVIHDDTVDRTSDGKGKVRNLTLDKLRLLDFGSWQSSKFSDQRISTLEEVLQQIKKSKIGLNIEIKSSAFEKKYSDFCIESQTLQLIQKYKLFNRIVISSFEPGVLMRLRELSANVKLAYLIWTKYKKLKLDPKAKKTKTGQYATSEDILQKLASKHEIIQYILEYRTYQKLKSTYVDALPNQIDKDT